MFNNNNRFNNTGNNRDGNDYRSAFGNGGNYDTNQQPQQNSGGFGNRFNKFGGGNRFGGFKNKARNHQGWFLVLLAIGLVVLVVVWKHTGQLGHEKNKWLNTPQEGIARTQAGIAQLQQVNKNVADKELDKQGHSEFRNQEVNNPVLLHDFFNYTPDIYSFGKIYSVFVFSNTDADKDWVQGIKAARNDDDLKIMTYNGNQAAKDDGTSIYKYFYHNYTVPKSNKWYGKVDGLGHPFMMMFVNGQPKDIIVNYKDFDSFIKKQNTIQNDFDKQANTYSLPKQPIGIDYPDYADMYKQAKQWFAKYTSQSNSSDTTTSDQDTSTNN